jgi:hypothetical protein
MRFAIENDFDTSLFNQALTTGLCAAIGVGRAPPGEVKPGHIMLAPPRMNLTAPRSTCIRSIIPGSNIITNQEGLKSII